MCALVINKSIKLNEKVIPRFHHRWHLTLDLDTPPYHQTRTLILNNWLCLMMGFFYIQCQHFVRFTLHLGSSRPWALVNSLKTNWTLYQLDTSWHLPILWELFCNVFELTTSFMSPLQRNLGSQRLANWWLRTCGRCPEWRVKAETLLNSYKLAETKLRCNPLQIWIRFSSHCDILLCTEGPDRCLF